MSSVVSSQSGTCVERVVVGVSGGVDSSVAVLLLKQQGYQVEAVFMKNWEEDDTKGYCGAAEDLADAERVCERLGVDLRAVNFSDQYWDRVFERFLTEHRALRTPNPDVLCNREIKFRPFLDYALGLGAHALATGHYARVHRGDAGYRLHKGADSDKDQSYFLHTLDQEQLEKTLFPLGHLRKSEVRARARAARLAVHEKKDSTGLCFIGERPFKAFLTRYFDPTPGSIETPEGEVIGSHDGLMFYTIGQRRGLKVGGRRGGSGAPWYVAAKDAARNVLVAAQGHEHPALYARALSASRMHWICGPPPGGPLRCAAKIRYRQADQSCLLTPSDGGRYRVRFDAPQWAIAPGQSVVFYAGDECLGGAIIDSACRS